jgi:hypothetical protein
VARCWRQYGEIDSQRAAGQRQLQNAEESLPVHREGALQQANESFGVAHGHRCYGFNRTGMDCSLV